MSGVSKHIKEIPIWLKSNQEVFYSLFNKNESFSNKLIELSQLEEVHKNTNLLWGKTDFTLKKRNLIVFALFRNGAYYLPSFLEHYFSKGVQHIVLMDNGSTDNSLEILRQYDNVTVLQNLLPYKQYQQRFKQYMIKRFAKNRWSLTVDIDELWDYPYSEQVNLEQLIEYLDKQGYSGVRAVMLDMFSKESFQQLSKVPPNNLKLKYPYYDADNLYKQPSSQLIGHVEIFGGIHQKLFGIHDIILSKIPLIKWTLGVKPFVHHSHFTDNVKLADFSNVLYHFKFTVHFKEKMEQVIREGNYWGGSSIYKTYAEAYIENPDLSLFTETSKELTTTHQLVECEVMEASEKYLGHFDL